MLTIVIGFGIFVLSAAGLGVGLLLRGRPLRAGCGNAAGCTGCDGCAVAPGRRL